MNALEKFWLSKFKEQKRDRVPGIFFPHVEKCRDEEARRNAKAAQGLLRSGVIVVNERSSQGMSTGAVYDLAD